MDKWKTNWTGRLSYRCEKVAISKSPYYYYVYSIGRLICNPWP